MKHKRNVAGRIGGFFILFMVCAFTGIWAQPVQVEEDVNPNDAFINGHWAVERNFNHKLHWERQLWLMKQAGY